MGLHEAAVQLAESGFLVFPCHTIRNGACSCGRECGSPGKHPRTGHGVLDATTRPDVLGGWWGAWPDANIGVACGHGLFVVDCDGPDGIAAWRELQAWHEPAPTASARTGGGGRHYYYRQPGHLTLTNRKGSLPVQIDVRGQGGYVLAPPSLHKSGQRYEWEEMREFAMVPAWLVAMLEPKRYTPQGKPTFRWSDGAGGLGTTPYGEAVLAHALGRVRGAVNGERNQTLARESFIIGQWCGGGEISPAGVDDLLIEACPDEDRKKTQTTVLYQLRAGAMYPRRKEEQ